MFHSTLSHKAGLPLLVALTLAITTFCTPLTAGASVDGPTLQLGKLAVTGTSWDPAKEGKFSASFGSTHMMGGTVSISALGQAVGSLGPQESIVRGEALSNTTTTSRTFTNHYSFSLGKASSFSLNLFSGKASTSNGFEDPGNAPPGNQLRVTLTNARGESITRMASGTT